MLGLKYTGANSHDRDCMCIKVPFLVIENKIWKFLVRSRSKFDLNLRSEVKDIFLQFFLKIKVINIKFKPFWFQKYIVCQYLKNIWPQKKTRKKRFWEWPQNDLTLYLKNYWSESSTIRIVGFTDQRNPIYQMSSRSEIWGLTTSVGLSWNCSTVNSRVGIHGHQYTHLSIIFYSSLSTF